jgi:tetratricopeptide (TPR) repeat protein
MTVSAVEAWAAQHPLYGRDTVLGTLRQRISGPPTRSAITGTAGVGKSHVAAALCVSVRETGGSAWQCDCGGAVSAADVVTRLLRVLDLGVETRGRWREGVVAIGQVLALTTGPVVLLLDGVDAVDATEFATLVSQLVASDRNGSLNVVTTSRRWPGSAVGDLIHLEPLLPADARALLVDLAARAGAPLSDDAGVDALVEALGNLPHALRLAAPWLRTVSPADLTRRLTTRRTFLDNAAGDPAGRSLSAAIGASWDRLSQRKRDFLTATLVFAGPFSAATADVVLGGAFDAPTEIIHALVADSLLQIVGGGSTRHRRFRAYAHVATFVAEMGPPKPETVAAHADYYAASVKAWGAAVFGNAPNEALGLLAHEVDDLLRAADALQQSDPNGAAAIVADLLPLAEFRSIGPGYQSRCEALSARVGPLMRARLAATLTVLQTRAVALSQAEATASAALQSLQSLESPVGAGSDPTDATRVEAMLCFALGRALAFHGRHVGAVRTLRRGLDCVAGDPSLAVLAARIALVLSIALLAQGHTNEALAEAERALAGARATDARLVEGFAMSHLTLLRARRGMFYIADTDLALFERHVDTVPRRVRGFIMGARAHLLVCAGQREQALTTLVRAEQLLQADGAQYALAFTGLVAAQLHALRGNLEEAARRARPLTQIPDTVIIARGQAWVLLAELAQLTGDLAGAEEAIGYAIDRTGAAQGAWLSVCGTTLKVLIACERGQVDVARDLLAVLDGDLETDAHGLAPRVEVARYAVAIAQALTHGPQEVAHAIAAARAGRPAKWSLPESWLAVHGLDAWVARLRPQAGAAPLQTSVSTLVVGPEAGWFQRDGGEPVDLMRRGAMRRLLDRLVTAHLEEQGPVDVYVLFEAGWPDQRIQPQTISSRVYNVLWRLRRAGLGDTIVTSDAGYTLSTTLLVRRSDGRAPG